MCIRDRFRAVDGYGLARVDFFVKDDGEVVFNEINTMPGFTAISMYPMLWEARGIGKDQLVGMLLSHGMEPVSYTHLDVYKRQAGGPDPP